MLRGVRVKALPTPNGERALLAAVIVQAVVDCQRGDISAADWLESTGRAWCALLGIEFSGAWQTADVRALRPRVSPEERRAQDRERGARYRARLRAAVTL